MISETWKLEGDRKSGAYGFTARQVRGPIFFPANLFFNHFIFWRNFCAGRGYFFYFSRFLGRFFQFIVFPTIFVGLFFSHQFCLRQILFSANFFWPNSAKYFFWYFEFGFLYKNVIENNDNNILGLKWRVYLLINFQDIFHPTCCYLSLPVY